MVCVIMLRCSCGCCETMPTATECICCSEIDKIEDKKNEEGVQCLTLHQGFQSVCLDVWVLQTAYASSQQHYGSNAPRGSVHE